MINDVNSTGEQLDAHWLAPIQNSMPLIGITTRRLIVDSRSLEVVEHEYGDAIAHAGGVPLLLPRPGEDLGHAWLGRIDGLLLTGGGDIDPCRYGADPATQVGGVDPERDAYEAQLILGALDRGLPVLGICRGCQMLNVVMGGSVHQHLPDITGLPHLVLGRRDQLAHEIDIEPGSQLAMALETDRASVNSIHHQAVDHCGQALRAVAWSSDGIIEGIEGKHKPALGVQWHPEALANSAPHAALFNWLVNQAATHGQMRRTEPDMESSLRGAPGRG